MAKTVSGVVWVGPIFHAGGYGNVSRNTLIGLNRLRCPVRAVNVGDEHRELLSPTLLRELEDLQQTDVGPRPALIVHRTPDSYRCVRWASMARTIGYTLFETDRIPDSWVHACRSMDEVWVPSQFNVRTFVGSGLDPTRVRAFPYGVNTEFFQPITETFPVPGRRSFCFLYISFFDYRKGMGLLLEAYLQEFTRQDDVTLIVKTSFERGHGVRAQDPGRIIADIVREQCGSDGAQAPHVVVLTDVLNQEELRCLYNTCDLYISTDRANGWGMPCMEAMAMGKPAATIDWSGSTEFMHEGNSLLIKPTGRLVSVDQRLVTARPMYAGHRWAEVTVESVRRVLRFAYENRPALHLLAQQGMADVRQHYSHLVAADRIRRYLLSLEAPGEQNGQPALELRAESRLGRLLGRSRRLRFGHCESPAVRRRRT